MKLPFSLKRRKKGDDEDGNDLDLDEEDEIEEDDAFDEDEEEGSAWERMDPQRKILIIAAVAGGLLLTSVIGGAAWFLLGSSDPEEAGPKEQRRADGSLVIAGGEVPGAPLPEGAEGKDGAPPKEEAALPKEPLVDGVSASQTAIQAIGKSGLSASGQAQDPDRLRIVPFATSSAYKGVRNLPEAEQLSRVPDPALIEKIDGGRVLPVVARNGTRPMDAYARPIADVNEAVPQVAILIRGIGMSRTASLTAIKSLPPEVSMVIDPYARDPADWVVRARLAGHEVFVELPMESINFPFEDAGPLALNSSVQVKDNLATLTNLMALVPGYVGFVSKFGSKYGVAEGQLRPVFETLRDRGLMFIDSGESGTGTMLRIATELQLPRARIDIELDRTPTESEIVGKILRLGALARSQSVAVAIGRPYPHTIRELQSWLAQQKPDKLRLVPASAVANRQVIQQ